MEYVGIAISILALVFSFFTYIRHDKKIKQQSKLINQYQLEAILKEKEESKKAIIDATVINEPKGNRKIKVYNKGKCIARNVKVIIPEAEGYHVFINPSPMDLRPHGFMDITLGAFLNNCPDTIEIAYNWSDDSDENNVDKQTIQIY